MRTQLWALLLVILVGSSYAKVFRPPSHSHVRRQQIDETAAESLAEYDPALNLPEEIPEQEPIPSEASEETNENAIPADDENLVAEDVESIAPESIAPESIAPKSIDAATLAPVVVTEQVLLSADGRKVLTKEEAEQVKNSFMNDPEIIEKLRNQAGVDAEELGDEIGKPGVDVHRDKNGGYYVVLRFGDNHMPANADGEEIYDSEDPIPDEEDMPEEIATVAPSIVTEKITEESAEEEVVTEAVPEVEVVPEVDEVPEVDAEVTVKPAEAPSTEVTEVIVAPDAGESDPAEEPAQEDVPVVETTQAPVTTTVEAPVEESIIKLPEIKVPSLDIKDFDTSIFGSVWFLILLLCCFI